jgi:phage/plasmid-like protein (TIGR03299 family)
MSRETQLWLENNLVIGDTDIRGEAWWYRGVDRADGTSNHFPGAIPWEVVRGLILPFEPIEQPLYIMLPDGTFHLVPNFKGVASENDPTELHAVHSDEYAKHPFSKWLLDDVYTLVDGEVHASSAGLLQKGAVAWVELSVAATMIMEGFEFRPHLLCSTSVNGRYQTTYGLKAQATVCDNTLNIADREQGQRISYRHTKGSFGRAQEIRDAVGLLIASGDDFKAEMERLLSWQVPSRIFGKWLDEMIPVKDKDGTPKEGASLTRAENQRDKMVTMWRKDDRVAPWAGTAFGVQCLSNTLMHYESTVTKAASRPERNMLNVISGKTAENDRLALEALEKVTTLYAPELLPV